MQLMKEVYNLKKMIHTERKGEKNINVKLINPLLLWKSKELRCKTNTIYVSFFLKSTILPTLGILN